MTPLADRSQEVVEGILDQFRHNIERWSCCKQSPCSRTLHTDKCFNFAIYRRISFTRPKKSATLAKKVSILVIGARFFSVRGDRIDDQRPRLLRKLGSSRCL